MRELPTPFTIELTSDARHAALCALFNEQIRRVMIDLGPDRRLNQTNQFCFIAAGSQCVPDVDFLVSEQAGTQLAFRCQPQTVAGIAKMVTDSADQADLSLGCSQSVAPGRTVGCTAAYGMQIYYPLKAQAHFIDG